MRKAADFSKCVSFARETFDKLFTQHIRDTLRNYPVGTQNEYGEVFWSGYKTTPTEIVFDSNDPLHVKFMTAAAYLMAKVIKLNLEGVSTTTVKVADYQAPLEEKKDSESLDDETNLAELLE